MITDDDSIIDGTVGQILAAIQHGMTDSFRGVMRLNDILGICEGRSITDKDEIMNALHYLCQQGRLFLIDGMYRLQLPTSIPVPMGETAIGDDPTIVS